MAPPQVRNAIRRPPRRGERPARRLGEIEADRAAIEAAAQGAAAKSDGAPPERRAVQAPSFTMGQVQAVGTRKLNALFYGPPGAGKTTLAASALDIPAMQDVLFIAAEPGDMSLTSRRTLDIIKINKWRQIARVFEYLTNHCRWRDEGNVEKLLESERHYKSDIIPYNEQEAEPREPEGRTWFEEQRLRAGKPMDEPYMYHTVILDSISELHKYLVYQYTGVDIGKTKLDDEIEKMEEWGPAQELFNLMLRSFRDLPGMSAIFVSAETIEPARKNNVRNPNAGMAIPRLAGKMAYEVTGTPDIVGYLDKSMEGGETTRYLYLGAGYEGWISKHRFENLPDLDFVENPTLSSLLDLARKDAQSHGSSETAPVPSRSAIPARRAHPAAPQRRNAAAAEGHDQTGSSRGPGRGGNTLRRSRRS